MLRTPKPSEPMRGTSHVPGGGSAHSMGAAQRWHEMQGPLGNALLEPAKLIHRRQCLLRGPGAGRRADAAPGAVSHAGCILQVLGACSRLKMLLNFRASQCNVWHSIYARQHRASSGRCCSPSGNARALEIAVLESGKLIHGHSYLLRARERGTVHSDV